MDYFLFFFCCPCEHSGFASIDMGGMFQCIYGTMGVQVQSAGTQGSRKHLSISFLSLLFYVFLVDPYTVYTYSVVQSTDGTLAMKIPPIHHHHNGNSHSHGHSHKHIHMIALLPLTGLRTRSQ